MVVGLLLSKHAPELVSQSQIQYNSPLIFHVAEWAIPWLRFPVNEIAFHPVAVAAWVGIFMTALNLLPGGQLDGPHYLRCVAGGHRFLTLLTIAVLVPLGVFYFTPG